MEKYIQEQIGEEFLEFMLQLPKNKQIWYGISYHSMICWENIKNHPELSWDQWSIPINPNNSLQEFGNN
jgi:hypothetical protein